MEKAFLAGGACILLMWTAALAQGEGDDWAFLQGFVPACNRTWTAPPLVETADTVFAPVMGNGHMAVCIGGNERRQVYYLRTADFWTDNGPGYAQVREIPSGCLTIGEVSKTGEGKSGKGAAGSYRQEEDILQAEIRTDLPVSSGRLQLVSYVAATENTLVAEVTNRSAGTIRVKAQLSDDVLHRTALPAKAGVEGDVVWLTRETGNRPGARWIARNAMAARVFGVSGVTYAATDASHAHASFDLPAGSTATIVVCLSGGKDATGHLAQARARVARFDAPAIAALKRAHREWWKNQWWLRSYVRTFDDVMDKYYFRSLYQLGTMCREGTVNSGLHGPWKASDTLHNYSSYCANDLGAASYYLPLLAGNRAQTARTWIQTCYDWIPEGRRRARADAGLARGILLPVHWAPWGTTYEDTYWNQKYCASYVSLVGNWYFKHTGDLACLKDRIYPFLRECADFYEDWLVKEPDGTYHVYKAASYEGGNTTNCCLDLLFARILFTDIVAYSELLGVDAARRDKWRDIRDHLNAFSTTTHNGKTVYQADAATPFNHSVNVIQTQILYPGYTCNRFSDPATRRIGQDTMRQAAAVGGWAQDNMLGQGFYCAAQRIGGFDVEELIGHYRKMLVDRKYIDFPAYIAGISLWGFNQQLCVQAYDEGVLFFPEYPRARRAKFLRLRTPGAFLCSGESRDGTIPFVDVHSEKGGPFTFIAPADQSRGVEVRDAGRDLVSTRKAGDRYTFDTIPGRTYRITGLRAGS